MRTSRVAVVLAVLVLMPLSPVNAGGEGWWAPPRQDERLSWEITDVAGRSATLWLSDETRVLTEAGALSDVMSFLNWDGGFTQRLRWTAFRTTGTCGESMPIGLARFLQCDDGWLPEMLFNGAPTPARVTGGHGPGTLTVDAYVSADSLTVDTFLVAAELALNWVGAQLAADEKREVLFGLLCIGVAGARVVSEAVTSGDVGAAVSELVGYVEYLVWELTKGYASAMVGQIDLSPYTGLIKKAETILMAGGLVAQLGGIGAALASGDSSVTFEFRTTEETPSAAATRSARSTTQATPVPSSAAASPTETDPEARSALYTSNGIAVLDERIERWGWSEYGFSIEARIQNVTDETVSLYAAAIAGTDYRGSPLMSSDESGELQPLENFPQPGAVVPSVLEPGGIAYVSTGGSVYLEPQPEALIHGEEAIASLRLIFTPEPAEGVGVRAFTVTDPRMTVLPDEFGTRIHGEVTVGNPHGEPAPPIVAMGGYDASGQLVTVLTIYDSAGIFEDICPGEELLVTMDRIYTDDPSLYPGSLPDPPQEQIVHFDAIAVAEGITFGNCAP